MLSAAGLCRLYAAEGLIHDARRYGFYLDTVFREVRFEGARVLDVGSGAGIVSGYAVIRGARAVLALEPESSGSSAGALQHAARLGAAAGVADRIELRGDPLESLEPDVEPFDVVVLHNSINHLDEAACMALRDDAAARVRYRDLIARVAAATRPGGQLIVSDCTSRNAFASIGLRNPFAPQIDWRKHQPPEEWIALFREAGFDRPSVRWTPVLRLYRPGRLLTGNRLVSWLTTSHFSFTMTRR